MQTVLAQPPDATGERKLLEEHQIALGVSRKQIRATIRIQKARVIPFLEVCAAGKIKHGGDIVSLLVTV